MMMTILMSYNYMTPHTRTLALEPRTEKKNTRNTSITHTRTIAISLHCDASGIQIRRGRNSAPAAAEVTAAGNHTLGGRLAYPRVMATARL